MQDAGMGDAGCRDGGCGDAGMRDAEMHDAGMEDVEMRGCGDAGCGMQDAGCGREPDDAPGGLSLPQSPGAGAALAVNGAVRSESPAVAAGGSGAAEPGYRWR